MTHESGFQQCMSSPALCSRHSHSFSTHHNLNVSPAALCNKGRSRRYLLVGVGETMGAWMCSINLSEAWLISKWFIFFRSFSSSSFGQMFVFQAVFGKIMESSQWLSLTILKCGCILYLITYLHLPCPQYSFYSGSASGGECDSTAITTLWIAIPKFSSIQASQ